VSPFRQETRREFCGEPVPLELPEIESDGSEVTAQRCDRVALGACASCQRPLCERHRSEDTRCVRRREPAARALQPQAPSSIARRALTFPRGPIGLTESAALLLGLSLGFPWIGAKLVILVVVIRLAIHVDRASSSVQTRPRWGPSHSQR
jgi:hypothetical protein